MAKYITAKNPSVMGFSARNIWRMKQFYETYQGNEKLSALLTEIGWSNNLHILSKPKQYIMKSVICPISRMSYTDSLPILR
jgi:hypothetical protein